MGQTRTPKTLDTVALADGLRPVLVRLSRELRREARAVGVSASQVSLLGRISQSQGIGVNELAAQERMTPPGMSSHVDKLVRAGLVARRRSEHDRRRIGLEPTDEGRRLLRSVRSRRTVWLARRLERLTAAERDVLAAAIEPLGLLLDEEERP